MRFCVMTGPDNKRAPHSLQHSYKDYAGVSYSGRCSFFGGTPALAEGLGWFIVVGLGGVFSLGVSFFIWLGQRSMPKRHGAEAETVSHVRYARK